MHRHPSPLELWATGYEFWMTAFEAQSVVFMRMMGMADLWNVTPHETTRMIAEKPEALGRAAMAAGLAAATGQRPDQIIKQATKPVRRKTRANSRRLAKRGPKLGVSR